MGFKKSEVSQLNSLASAIKLIEFDANKYTITHLYGRKVADSLEYPKGINTRKGVGKWLGEKSAMLLSNVVVNNAIHIFGYDPQNPTESTREMDFNALVDLLITMERLEGQGLGLDFIVKCVRNSIEEQLKGTATIKPGKEKCGVHAALAQQVDFFAQIERQGGDVHGWLRYGKGKRAHRRGGDGGPSTRAFVRSLAVRLKKVNNGSRIEFEVTQWPTSARN